MTGDEVVGWHHRLYGHEFEQAPGVCDGQGSLACCGPWSRKSRTRLSHWTASTLLGVTIGSCFGASRADACWTPRSTLRMAVTSLFSPAGGGGGGFQPGHDGYGNRLASCSAGARGAGGAGWAFPGLPLELPPGSRVWAASLLTISLVSSRCPGADPTPLCPGNKTQSPGLQAY